MCRHIRSACRFNPRSREGSDSSLNLSMPPRLFQSTLPRGERQPPQHSEQPIGGFQSTLPRGERLVLKSCSVQTRCFNPRFREGSDMEPDATTFCDSGFNPRSREGSDQERMSNTAHQRVSIHAPARGATPQLRPTVEALMFQSTLPRGERQTFRSGLCD